MDAKSFADRGQGRATGARLYLCGQSQQQGKALCLGRAFSPKTFDEGIYSGFFVQKTILAFHFHMKLDDNSFQCQL